MLVLLEKEKKKKYEKKFIKVAIDNITITIQLQYFIYTRIA